MGPFPQPRIRRTMRRMKYKQLAKFLAHNSFSPLLAMLLALSSLHAFAGGNVENGGDGVIDGSTVYSLDLVERGLERSPFVGEDIPVPQEVQTLVDKFLQNKVPSDTAAILARKVARMKANHEAALYRSVRKVLDSYTLVMIQAPLKIVDDQDSPIDNRAITRVAAHSADDQAIQVNLNGFSAMDPQNQAALLTHEIIYASATDKTSRPSRNIAATLFDPAFKTDSLDVRYRVAQKRFFGQA